MPTTAMPSIKNYRDVGFYNTSVLANNLLCWALLPNLRAAGWTLAHRNTKLGTLRNKSLTQIKNNQLRYPTQESKMNPTDYWEESDCLGRKQEAQDVIAFLQSMHGQGFSEGDHLQGKKHFTLNITAEWGAGKTFFLKGLEYDLAKIGHPVVYFDAWKNDLSNDPIASFIAQISSGLLDKLPETKIKTSLKESAWNLLKAGGKTFISAGIKKATGFAIEEFSEVFVDNLEGIDKDKIGEAASSQLTKIIDEHLKQPKAIDAFKKSILAIGNDVYANKTLKMPIYIIIDELDRCRPTYAVQLLESVKHIFETDGVYVIFGTNKEELVHTIKKVYGQNFNAEGYLRRFFDMEFRLEPSENKALGDKLFKPYNQIIKKTIIFTVSEELAPSSLQPHQEMFDNTMIALLIHPREQERIFHILLNSIRITGDSSETFHFYPLLIMSTSIVCFENSFQRAKNSLLKGSLDQLGDFIRITNEKVDRRIEHPVTTGHSLMQINDIYQKLILEKTAADQRFSPLKFPSLSVTFIEHCKFNQIDLKEHINLIAKSSKFIKN